MHFWIQELLQQITTLQNRVKSAETRADEYESEKAELEQDSTELRQRAATLSDELEKVKAESSIKISEYKRSASQGMDTSNEIYQKQLADKEVELETIQVKYLSGINGPEGLSALPKFPEPEGLRYDNMTFTEFV